MCCIAIDLGGTVIKIGLVDGDKLLDFRSLSSVGGGLSPNLSPIGEQIDNLLEKWNLSANDLSGIGLAFPGMVDPEKKRVTSTNDKYDDACGMDLNRWVGERWGVPFILGNDARLAVSGEWRFGAGRNTRNMVMMTLGTGIGTGVILDGRLIKGQHFQAGSLGGHIVVSYRGRRCTCGNVGCVEAMASSFFLPEIIRSCPGVGNAFKANAGEYDFKALFALMRRGDPEATVICRECMDVWAAAIVNYIHAYDPEVIVIGGGIMKSADLIIPYLRERIDDLVWSPESKKVAIQPSELGDHAALLGISSTLSTLKKEEMYEQQVL